MVGIGGLWIDFNLSDNALSWYCRKSSFDKNIYPGSSDYERVWNLVTLFAEDVEVVQIHRPINSEEALIYFKLKDPCISSFDDNQAIIGASDNLKLVVSCNSSKAASLLSKVLPYLFKSKFHHSSIKVSSSK
ncbi:hypothetical protein NQ317_000199, partial [Molorchus minor]